jgi:DNA-binding transcriptional MerR regulator
MRLPPRQHRDVLKIGELAELLSTTTRTIRLYEELGVIVPARTEAGTRLYARKDLKRMAVALALSRCGVDLKSIGLLSTLRSQCETGAQAAENVLPQLANLQAGIRTQMEQLAKLERDIDRARDLVGRCANCPNHPNRHDCPHCEVDKNIELSDVARLIWDPDCP